MGWGWLKSVGTVVAITAAGAGIQAVNTISATDAANPGHALIPFPWNLLIGTGAAIGTGYITNLASKHNPDGSSALDAWDRRIGRNPDEIPPEGDRRGKPPISNTSRAVVVNK